jgi:signal transduction histidine kinase
MNFFELSKLEANQIRPNKEPFIISELMNDISSKYHLLARDKKIKLTAIYLKN